MTSSKATTNAQSRVAEVAREHGWPKSLDPDENFKPKYTLFCRELRFVAIYALFGDLWGKKCLLGSKTVFLGQEIHYYMVYIAYFTRLNWQICNCAQNDVTKKLNTRLTKVFKPFLPSPNACQLLPPCHLLIFKVRWGPCIVGAQRYWRLVF